MKAYTDIEQSRKLAEILPLESADMCYIKDKPNIGFLHKEYKEFGDTILQDVYPCWSLAALLDIIPYVTANNDGEDLRLHMDKDCSRYCLFYENEYTGDMNVFETDMYDNMVDACYDIIMKLKERDLL